MATQIDQLFGMFPALVTALNASAAKDKEIADLKAQNAALQANQVPDMTKQLADLTAALAAANGQPAPDATGAPAQ